jgi:hypothetical protein
MMTLKLLHGVNRNGLPLATLGVCSLLLSLILSAVPVQAESRYEIKGRGGGHRWLLDDADQGILPSSLERPVRPCAGLSSRRGTFDGFGLLNGSRRQIGTAPQRPATWFDASGQDKIKDGVDSSPWPFSRPVPPTEPKPLRKPIQSGTEESLRARINRRYQDPQVVRLLNTVPADRCLILYQEVLTLIASRHLEPTPPVQQVDRGMSNLLQAVENPAFWQANQATANPQQVHLFQQTVAAADWRGSVHNMESSVAVLRWMMDLAYRQLGLNPAAVTVEFVYGAVESLNQYSAFLPLETVQATHQLLGETVVGIGVQVKHHEQGLIVAKVVQGGSAAAAGLRKGDVILAVNGAPLAGIDLDTASRRVSGPAGSPV